MDSSKTSIYVPDKTSTEEALHRTTHLAIGAHSDDLEIFAFHGIATCYRQTDRWFGGVTVTDGAGCPGKGERSEDEIERIKAVRFREQNKAANIGKYSFQCQMGYTSDAVKDYGASRALVTTLTDILDQSSPEVLYLHNPFDKHTTHLAVLQRCIEALRNLSRDRRPQQVFGCEVWRGLDWLRNADKIILHTDQNLRLARKLIKVFRSQIADAKNYVQATLGRRCANATYFDSHSVDQVSSCSYAVDLSPLLEDDEMTLQAFVGQHLDRFSNDVLSALEPLTSKPEHP